ncbi:MAG: indolepyruvate ferredoxin oxidoreductase subunit beta [Methanomicrobiales archaeon]|nr:indolepyruvate ferredoxin oxidoreductase subunit beta [Methanomicrobiales archaeon]
MRTVVSIGSDQEGTLMEICNVLIVGIGGQGVILASNVLGEACIHAGIPVRSAETHGMAQRGGSVDCHVRIGSRFGPLIPKGGADILISFELLEALRFRHFLRRDGVMILNDLMVVPTSVFVQGLEVPQREAVISRLEGEKYMLIPASKLAEEAGSALTQNIVMIGAASPYLPIPEESLLEGVKQTVPAKTREMNTRAFHLGRTVAEEKAK